MTKAKGNIMGLLNSTSIKDVEKKVMNNKGIPLSQIRPNKKNKYRMNNIVELANNIEELGLLQRLVVTPSEEKDENGEPIYTLLSGHRRFMALTMLVEERGNKKYRSVLCDIQPDNEDEVKSLAQLHFANLMNRRTSDYERMLAIIDLRDYYKQVKENNKTIKGRIGDLIADAIGMGRTQVQKSIHVFENADEELLRRLEDEEISISVAYDELHPKEEDPEELPVEDPTEEPATQVGEPNVTESAPATQENAQTPPDVAEPAVPVEETDAKEVETGDNTKEEPAKPANNPFEIAPTSKAIAEEAKTPTAKRSTKEEVSRMIDTVRKIKKEDANEEVLEALNMLSDAILDIMEMAALD